VTLSFWLSHKNPTCVPLLLDLIVLIILVEEYKLWSFKDLKDICNYVTFLVIAE
jgi:hypothetical protein